MEKRTCAASEMSRMTMSDDEMTSKTSPSVPLALVKPHASASAHEGESLRRPMATVVSFMPASANESRKFCACAGACEPQPMTPIFLMPSKALGNSLKRSRPPLITYSSVPGPANCTSSRSNTRVSKLRSAGTAARATTAEAEAGRRATSAAWRGRGARPAAGDADAREGAAAVFCAANMVLFVVFWMRAADKRMRRRCGGEGWGLLHARSL
jgi:hypothetical protein